MGKQQAIRLAEKQANATGKIYHVIRICPSRGFDIVEDGNLTGHSWFKAIPVDRGLTDMELSQSPNYWRIEVLDS